MRFIEGHQRSVSTAPIAEFDPKSPFAGMYLMALLGCPKDRRGQQHTLATYAAEMIAYCKARSPELSREMFDLTVKAAAAQMGVSEQDVLAMPQSRPIAQAIAHDAHNMQPYIEEELLTPAGGFQSLAEAPGSAVLRAAWDAALSGPVRNVGVTLTLIASLDRFHTDIPGSLNRAFAIMEADAPGGRRSSVTARTLRAHWLEWRGVAPLAAALRIWCHAVPPTQDGREHIAGAFATTEGVSTLLSWAQWFRAFGVLFAPSRGQKSIIPEAEAVQYRVNVPILTPPLTPLSPEELHNARGYRAPTTKFG